MPCSRSISFSSPVRLRVVILSGFVGVLLAFSGASGPAVAGGGWDVCAHGCQYDQVGPALAAAQAGDTIKVGPGVYRGGLTITNSVNLVGSGKHATVIRGGGPVITIGTFNAATKPTVSIRGMTLTGGISRTSPMSVAYFGQDGVYATGGGVLVPPGLDDEPGATVSITNSAITGNRVAPRATITFGETCPAGPCRFAVASGGGIASWGNLTLVGTSVSHNLVGTASGLSALASDVGGGAIQHGAGDLMIRNSSFEANQVSARAPNGRYAEGGAIIAEGHTVTMSHDVFRRNSATLIAGLPDSVETLAQAGAVHLRGQLNAATIRDTGFYDNSAKMTNTAGSAYANSGGVHGDLLITLSGSTFSHNSVVATTLSGSPGNASGDAGAGEVSGSITGTRFTGNTVTARSAAGDASAAAGAAIFSGTMTRSLIKDNRVRASSPHGKVTVIGAGLLAGDFELTLKRTDVTGNLGVATGSRGTAKGGGIYDAPGNGPPGGPLQLIGGSITHNTLTGGAGITLSGGGVFSTYPVDLTKTLIAGNSPDQCAGFSTDVCRD